MGSRGRPTNLIRNAALAAGEATYRDEANPCWCGCMIRYSKNAQCQDCLIAKGKARYAALQGDALLKRKADDHARYLARLAKKE